MCLVRKQKTLASVAFGYIGDEDVPVPTAVDRVFVYKLLFIICLSLVIQKYRQRN